MCYLDLFGVLSCSDIQHSAVKHHSFCGHKLVDQAKSFTGYTHQVIQVEHAQCVFDPPRNWRETDQMVVYAYF